ncbi:MAG: folylpolyglutamate synthase/dihydrofolate synthase family protein [Clostridia bacterium]|nr:folylpolyglutamate synthase/dihydrofolate synthase family protein [Clostridia bacterium]
MNYNETLNYIHSLGAFSHKASLERIEKVMSKLNNPQNDFKAIHIAGTNGKGSVCTFVSSVLKESGYMVGKFVSPYITDFCERIQINDRFISRDDLCRLSQKVIDTGVALTEFEFITAVGFLYFSENNIDVAVVETGLGGRFDATNVLPSPLVSVITKISLDHTAVLGDTIEQITPEKCGIIKNNTVVTTPNQDSAALAIIKKHSDNTIIPKINLLEKVNISLLGNAFIYDNAEYTTSLGGEYQIDNVLTAIEVLKNCGLNINQTDMQIGLSNAFLPARLEVVSQNPLIVVDGAHNPDGAEALSQVLKEHQNSTAIIGVMKDKNYGELLHKTLPYFKNIICITPDVPRALPADELAESAKPYCDNVFAEDNFDTAIALAKQKCDGKPIFIYGSLYLASQMRPYFKK